jgi:hypothetical protein
MGKERNVRGVLLRKRKERDHLEILVVDGRILLE